MDVLRGLAIVLVLALHATLVVERHGVEPWARLVALNQVLAPYRMPMLMLLSGLLLERAMRKGWRRYYEGKLDKLVYPLVVWTTISLAVIGPDLGLADPRSYLGPYHLWFILFLGIFYAVAPLLERVNTAVVVLACLVASGLSPDGSKYGERLFVLMAFFFLGHALAKRQEFLGHLTTLRAVLLALPVALALSAYAVIEGGAVVYGPLLFLPVVCGIVVLIFIVRVAIKHGLGQTLAFMGRNSLVFYVSHYPLMFWVMGAALGMGVSLPIIFALSMMTTLGAGTLLVILAAKWGVVRALFERPRSSQISFIAKRI